MGTWSIGHWLIVLVIVLLLFGANKIPKLMGDVAKGVKAFKQGLKEGEDEVPTQPPLQAAAPQPPVTPTSQTDPLRKP